MTGHGGLPVVIEPSKSPRLTFLAGKGVVHILVRRPGEEPIKIEVSTEEARSLVSALAMTVEQSEP